MSRAARRYAVTTLGWIFFELVIIVAAIGVGYVVNNGPQGGYAKILLIITITGAILVVVSLIAVFGVH